MSINRRVDKATMGYLHNGILLGWKKEENFTLVAAWVDPENIMLSEISQSEKDNFCMILLTRAI